MKIICPVNMFTLEQPIYVLKDNSSKLELIKTANAEELPMILATYTAGPQRSTITLAGNPSYCLNIKEEINAILKKDYNLSNVEVEICPNI